MNEVPRTCIHTGLVPGQRRRGVAAAAAQGAWKTMRIGIPDDWRGPWQYDGPNLKIEFSRVSERRLGALTLVLDAEYGSSTTVAWCLSKRETLEDAICDLRCREGTTIERIGHVRLNQQATIRNALEVEDPTVAWACVSGANPLSPAKGVSVRCLARYSPTARRRSREGFSATSG